MLSRVSVVRRVLSITALLLVIPIGVSAVVHQATGPGPNWWGADRSSAGLLPVAADHQGAVVRVLAARTVRWRGIFAHHCWIVFKPKGAASYTRYDYTAWGEPIRRNGFEPDGRWFGRDPHVVFAADGEAAERLIPAIEAAIARYPLRQIGDYRAWPGPNSNTFVAAVLGDAVVLPPTAIGKDYPHDGRWLRLSATGVRLSLGGYAGLALGWVEGIEANILGAVIGVDLRRPALKLPGVGRIGMAPVPTAAP